MRWLGLAFMLLLMASATGCTAVSMTVAAVTGAGSSSGNVQANTRGIEELFLSEGEGPHTFRYAEDLLYQGRYREAAAAYYHCEMAAYTTALREAARTRRMWVQEMIVAYENGDEIQPPPVVDNSPYLRVAPKPMYGEQDFYGQSEISVLSANPRQLTPHKHYVQDEAAYHIYGYPNYQGDISPSQIKVPEKPPYPQE